MGEFALDFDGLIRRLAARWRRHALNALLAGSVIYGVTFIMPPWYRSAAVLLPPEETEQMGTGLSVQRFLSRMPSLGGLSNYYTPADLYRAILMSRSVQEAVIRRFDLTGVYHTNSMEKTLKEFRNHTRTVLAPDGTISVSVEDRSRERAAQVANALVEELDRFNVERRNFQAKRTRIFLERRVAETDSLSRLAESQLGAYQEKHHMLVPLDPDAQSLKPLADLMARKIALEVQLEVLRSYLTPTNELVVQTRTELEQLKNQIGNMPGLETELGRQARDVRLYQQVYLLLNAQLEDARLRETMDTPTVTVLDPAVPAERRARPLRLPWAAAAAALAGLVSVLWSERPAALRELTRRTAA
jgi:tyrosine-protein kinase Etk/Wzc